MATTQEDEKQDGIDPKAPNDSSSGSRSPVVENSEDAPRPVWTQDGKRIIQEHECYDKLGYGIPPSRSNPYSNMSCEAECQSFIGTAFLPGKSGWSSPWCSPCK